MSHLDIGSARAESGLRGPAEPQSVRAVEVLNSGVEQHNGSVEMLNTFPREVLNMLNTSPREVLRLNS